MPVLLTSTTVISTLTPYPLASNHPLKPNHGTHVALHSSERSTGLAIPRAHAHVSATRHQLSRVGAEPHCPHATFVWKRVTHAQSRQLPNLWEAMVWVKRLPLFF